MKWDYSIDRRQFLKLTGAASLAMFGAPLWGERNLKRKGISRKTIAHYKRKHAQC